MTNPLGTLTEKFDTLSSDVQSYIASVQTDIAAVASAVGAGNAILSDILSALSQLQSTMQTAADCACEAASTLQEIADNQPPPPPPSHPCEDPEVDPNTLGWDQIGNNIGWVAISGTGGRNYRGDLSPMAPILITSSGPGGGLIMPGPGWYRLRGNYPVAPYNYWTMNYSLDGNTTIIANPTSGGVSVSGPFFCSGGENLVLTLAGNEDAAEGDADIYVWYLEKCEQVG